jgi:carboxyl-terminal processing protease
MRRIPLFALLLALGLSNALAQEQAPPNDAEGGRVVASSDDPDAAESQTTKVPLAEIRRYVGVYDAIKQAYVDPVDDHKLMQSAIKGLLLDLDPHSAYLE